MLTPSTESSEGDETEQNQTPALQMHSFRWVQFEENIKRSYQQLREKNMFNDVTISCENSEVEAHKIVLATSSDFFSRLLERSSFRNNPHPIIHIKDVKMKHLMFILEFMYTGEVKVPQNDSTSVLQAAKELEVKGLPTDDFNRLNPAIRKRQANQLSSSSALSFPIKRSHTNSFSPIQSSSRGSSSKRLQPKIKLEESPVVENDSQEGAEDGSEEKDKDDRQENAEDDKQEKANQFSSSSALSFPIKRSRFNTFSPIQSSSRGSSPKRLQPKIKPKESSFVENESQEGAEDSSKEKDKDDRQENAEDDKQEKDQIILEIILEKAVSTSSPSDEKMSRESQRAALVEKVESRLFKCKQCGYTSKTIFNVKKHAEGHLSPLEYKCQFCPSVVKNEVYFKHHMRAKHNIKV